MNKQTKEGITQALGYLNNVPNQPIFPSLDGGEKKDFFLSHLSFSRSLSKQVTDATDGWLKNAVVMLKS